MASRLARLEAGERSEPNQPFLAEGGPPKTERKKISCSRILLTVSSRETQISRRIGTSGKRLSIPPTKEQLVT